MLWAGWTHCVGVPIERSVVAELGLASSFSLSHRAGVVHPPPVRPGEAAAERRRCDCTEAAGEGVARVCGESPLSLSTVGELQAAAQNFDMCRRARTC